MLILKSWVWRAIENDWYPFCVCSTHRTPVWIIRKRDLIPDETTLLQTISNWILIPDIMCNYDDHEMKLPCMVSTWGLDKSEPLYSGDRLLFGAMAESLAGYPALPWTLADCRKN